MSDIISVLQDAVARGIPILAQEPLAWRDDLMRSMYYGVKTVLPNASVVFPHHGSYFTTPALYVEMHWLVDSDDYGLSDMLRHEVCTSYHPGTAATDWNATFSIRKTSDWISYKPLSQQEILSNWETLKRILPTEMDFHERFDILKWYEVMNENF